MWATWGLIESTRIETDGWRVRNPHICQRMANMGHLGAGEKEQEQAD